MPRFAILDHDWPEPHADLLLENEATLLTWRLPPIAVEAVEGRAVPYTEPVVATRLPDHRRLYLEYEGPVSGDRGRVRRIDEGVFEWIERDAARWVIDLAGRRFAGRIELTVEDASTGRARLSWTGR
jgi:hypothetical protein